MAWPSRSCRGEVVVIVVALGVCGDRCNQLTVYFCPSYKSPQKFVAVFCAQGCGGLLVARCVVCAGGVGGGVSPLAR